VTFNIEIQPAVVSFTSDGVILEDALVQNIPLEYSCKTGDCGTCCAEILSGSIETKDGELVHSGKFLTCQSKAKSDLILKANYYPELVHIKQKIVPCKVVIFDYAAKDVVVIIFRLPPKANFEYLPGQHVDLSFNGVKRSYSIANAICDNKSIELHIRNLPNGKMSGLLFGDLKENQLMRIEGPKGTFFVRDNTKPLILVATGTGIAPIKAIVEDLVNKGDRRPIHVYWGMRHLEDFYCKELIDLAEELEHINLNKILSGGSSEVYKNGYVQNSVVADFSELSDYEVYACGSIKMIDDARKLFIEHGLPAAAFHSDAFTPAKKI
jgi:CDP-4-dehydro-6-deoxyglucose reductase